MPLSRAKDAERKRLSRARLDTPQEPPQPLSYVVQPKVDNKGNLISEAPFHAYMHQHWMDISIPFWTRVRDDSLASGDSPRHDYAVWMLNTVLVPWDSPISTVRAQ